MADATDVQTMNRVLVLVGTALDMVNEALNIAQSELGDHRVTHEANVAWNSLNNTHRMTETQIKAARKG